jgi:hypothetical protein
MEGCLPNYSNERLCPDPNGDLTPTQLHVRVKLGYDVARAVCQSVSRYNGKWSVPEDVREGCAQTEQSRHLGFFLSIWAM